MPDLSVNLAPQNPSGLVLRNPVAAAAGTFGYGTEYGRVRRGHTNANIGHKLLSPDIMPLGKQQVAPDDSVLGALANPAGPGLTTSYAALIKQAFDPSFWSAAQPVAAAGGQFTQMEANFSLFWGLAIDLYESTLVTGETPVDTFAAGNLGALTAQQQGLSIFNGQGRCNQCHSGPLFTDATKAGFAGFHNTGVTRTADDLAAGPRANNAALNGAFKTPGLRNVELTGPYMHNGSMATLRRRLPLDRAEHKL